MNVELDLMKRPAPAEPEENETIPRGPRISVERINNKEGWVSINGWTGFPYLIKDSGAVPCIITKAGLRKFPKLYKPFVLPVQTKLKTVTGEYTSPRGQTESLEVEFYDQETNLSIKRYVKFLVLDTLDFDILLGNSLWISVGAKTDLARETVTVHDHWGTPQQKQVEGPLAIWSDDQRRYKNSDQQVLMTLNPESEGTTRLEDASHLRQGEIMPVGK